MEVEFRVSKEDYIGFYKTQLTQNFLKRMALIAVALFFIVFSVYTNQQFSWLKLAVVTCGYGIIVALSFYFVPIWIFKNKLKKLIATETGYSKQKVWTIKDEGLLSKSLSATSLRNWESFSSANADAKYISLYLLDKRFLLLPKSSFSSDAEATNFLGLVHSKILSAKNKSGLISNKNPDVFEKKNKPPYLIGFLGIIPVVGAVTGLVLIINGVFKYKNNWLILIGAAGVCFNIGIYGFLSYADKANLFKQGFVVLNEKTLNSLVKEIEFYKVQYGKYPESLKLLNLKNQLINYHDPLMSDKNDVSFNYHLTGKGYTIFSSGLDKTPNTADDIYPTLEIDSLKVGLIIDR